MGASFLGLESLPDQNFYSEPSYFGEWHGHFKAF